jgi:hypothetical protein
MAVPRARVQAQPSAPLTNAQTGMFFAAGGIHVGQWFTPCRPPHAVGGGGLTLSASNALYATYVPVNQATLRAAMEARRRGRSKLR